ncbi:MAG: hypothetical protein K2Q06_09355, partial [Parvularculaceae bacterium]|nr:hypothetical protein [Parvularculaceae bacterium]
MATMLAAAALSTAASAAAPRTLSPFLTAAEHLAARGADAPADCIAATYAVVEDAKESERRFVSCPRFLAFSGAGATRIYDFATERLLLVEGGDALAMSTHAVAYFRRLEMQNRKRISADLSAGRSLSPARQETELQAPFGDSYVALDRRPIEGGEAFFAGADEIARVVYGAPAPSDEVRRAAYFFFGLHPVVAEAMATRGVLPSVVSTASGALGAGRTIYRLKESALGPAAFPLDASKAMLTPDSTTLAYDRALALALRRNIVDGLAPAFALDALVARMDRRLAANDTLGGYLTALVLMWTHEQAVRACGQTFESAMCGRLKTVLVAGAESGDPDLLSYFKASQAEIDDAPKEGLAALDQIDMRRRDDAYALETLRALLLIRLRNKGETTAAYPDPDSAAARAFARALLGAPAMTSVLYDAGVDRVRNLDPAGGWVFFDAARA